MTKINVYVFGHYDSRGGTIAIRVDEHEGELERIKKEYNKGMGWSEEKGKHIAAGVGRETDNKVADMCYPGGPAKEDYMWPATIEWGEEIRMEEAREKVEKAGMTLDLEGESTGEEISEEWWVVTPDMKAKEQIEKWGAVRLRVIKREDTDDEGGHEWLEDGDAEFDLSCDISMYGLDGLRWCHPSWSDDAFAMLLVDMTNQPEHGQEGTKGRDARSAKEQ